MAIGGAKGLENPRAFLIPYYDYAAGRPGAVVAGTADKPLFYTAHIDWYRSNASTPWGDSRVADGIAYANGGVKYIPKTDGTTNDCFERFFVTVSPKFEETLPNIPNPKSPWKHIAGTHQWRSHGAGNRERDKAYWYNIWRHGMRKCLITDHEVCWRDGGESFTFRTKAAPKKGGDKGMYDSARYMQDTLGFVYGPYNNFTDFAPVNEYWSTDMIARQYTNQLQPAWARCYGPKPQYARYALGPLRLRLSRAWRGHVRRDVLLLRRNHAPSEKSMERPRLFRRAAPLLLQRFDGRQLRAGSFVLSAVGSVVCGFRSAQDP